MQRLTRRLGLIAVMVCSVFGANAKYPVEVRVFPTCEITPNDRVVLEVLVNTPNTPAFLYRPTEVLIENGNVIVSIFPDSGGLTAYDTILVTVDLGYFGLGAHSYDLIVYPAKSKELGSAIGQFVVTLGPCQAALESPKRIYWADYKARTIKRATLDGAKVENLAIAELGAVSGLVPDFVHRKLYWSDIDWGNYSMPAQRRIMRCDLGVENVELLMTADQDLRVLGVDSSEDKLYWVDDYRIRRCNLDGSGSEDLVTNVTSEAEIVLSHANKTLFWIGRSGVQAVPFSGGSARTVVSGIVYSSGLTVDAQGGHLYWGGSGKIWRAGIDGSGLVPLIDVGLAYTLSIALDREAGKLYWSNGDYHTIYRANLDGSNVQPLIHDVWYGHNLVIDHMNGKMYWVVPSDNYDGQPRGRLQRANLDGSEIEDVATRLMSPRGMTADFCGWAAGLSRPTHELVVDCLAGPGSFIPNACQCADLSADERVDLVDYSILQRAFALD